jgi:mono/diheme cytochrome c family protein
VRVKRDKPERRDALHVKNFVICFVTPFFLFPLAVVAYFALGFADTPSDVKPPAWEAAIMQPAVRAAVKRRAANLSAPGPATEESIIAGGKLYVMGCMGCHGEPGKPYAEDHANYPPVPQLSHVGTQYSDPEIYSVIKHGIRMTAMSAYGSFYEEEQLWSLAAFIRRINTLTPAEIQSLQPTKH